MEEGPCTGTVKLPEPQDPSQTENVPGASEGAAQVTEKTEAPQAQESASVAEHPGQPQGADASKAASGGTHKSPAAESSAPPPEAIVLEAAASGNIRNLEEIASQVVQEF